MSICVLKFRLLCSPVICVKKLIVLANFAAEKRNYQLYSAVYKVLAPKLLQKNKYSCKLSDKTERNYNY